MSEFISVWHGERGHYLSAAGPYVSSAARTADEGEYVGARVRSKATRGFRAPGFRLRDTVLRKLSDIQKMSLREVCDVLESTGQKDKEQIARALLDLVREERAARSQQHDGRQPRWVYWRLV